MNAVAQYSRYRGASGGFLKPNYVEEGGRLPRRVSFDDIGAFQALIGELSKNIDQGQYREHFRRVPL
jgi:hypothetical protein